MVFEEFISEETIIKAFLYDFIVMGEAARNIPTEVRKSDPQIPWLSMGDLRNIVAHEYFRVDLEIVWDSIQNDLELLTIQLQSLLEHELNSDR